MLKTTAALVGLTAPSQVASSIPRAYSPITMNSSRGKTGLCEYIPLLPPFLFLSWFSLAMHAVSSQGIEVLCKQGLSSGTAITYICGFRDARRYYNWKNSQAVKGNTRQGESEFLSAFNTLHVFMVLWCFLYPFHSLCHIFHSWDLLRKDTLNTLWTQLPKGLLVSLTHTYSLSSCDFKC